jgi:2-iminobutanoate/2-iminopropanoate deaminase
MKKRVINVPALETGAPYNLCVCYGDMVYVSGLLPCDAEFSKNLREARASGSPPPPFPDLSFERQVEIAMDNLKTVMEAAGSNMDCLLKVMVWLKDQGQQHEFDRIYRRYFRTTEVLPARTRLQAGRLPMNCEVEIEAVGYIPTD